jgi:hypothetical protein
MDNVTSHQVKTSCRAIAVLLILVGIFALPLGAAQPLSQEDVTLLLIGGASESKMITLVEQRGVDFQLNPELIQKFKKDGATQALIDAIVNSNRKSPIKSTTPATEAPSRAPGSGSGISPELPGSGPQVSNISNPPPSTAQAQDTKSAEVNQKVNTVMAGLASGSGQGETPPALASGSKQSAASNLSDPSPAEIQNIIHSFAAKELMFKEARDNYTYRQINKVETLDADGQVNGFWQQNWDILFDNNGNRIEKVTYAPPGSLKGVLMTEQDLDAMRSIQPFVLTSNDLSEYDIKYLGHVKVDYITAYVFSIRPKEIRKHQQYFQGVIWVDDRDLQIVKTEGRQVPEIRNSHGENLFPRFTTWRQQIDGKFWFPTFTLADDTLYFPSGPVHIKEIIRYTDYKQFKSTSVIKAVQSIDTGKPIPTPNSSTPSSTPPPKK